MFITHQFKVKPIFRIYFGGVITDKTVIKDVVTCALKQDAQKTKVGRHMEVFMKYKLGLPAEIESAHYAMFQSRTENSKF